MADETGTTPWTLETDPDQLNLGTEALGYLMWRATMAWTRAATAALSPSGLTHAQFAILGGIWWLQHNSGPPDQKELAAHAGTESRMTSDLVEVLRSRDLIAKTRDPLDGRRTRLTVTRAGSEASVAALEALQRLERDFFADCDHEAGRAFLQTVLESPIDE